LLIFDCCPIFDDASSHYWQISYTLDIIILRFIWYAVLMIDLYDTYMPCPMMDASDGCMSCDGFVILLTYLFVIYEMDASWENDNDNVCILCFSHA
jgi:hypothetical protein